MSVRSFSTGPSERPGGDRFARRPDCLFKGADGSKVDRTVSSVRAELTYLVAAPFRAPEPRATSVLRERGSTKKVTVWDHIGHRDLGG